MQEPLASFATDIALSCSRAAANLLPASRNLSLRFLVVVFHAKLMDTGVKEQLDAVVSFRSNRVW